MPVLIPFLTSGESVVDEVVEVVVLFEAETVVTVVVVVEPSAAEIPSTLSIDGAKSAPSDAKLEPKDLAAAWSSGEFAP